MYHKLLNFLLGKLYYLLWISLHIAYELQLEIRNIFHYTWKLIVQRLLTCWPPYSQEAQLGRLAKTTKTYAKLPKHIAISVVDNQSKSLLYRILDWTKTRPRIAINVDDEKRKIENVLNEKDLQSLAKVISWAWAAHIPQISLYDYHGKLKNCYRELGCHIQDEIIQNFWMLKEHHDNSEPPVVKFHNVTTLNGYTNGINGMKSSPPVHISVFSNDDGKPAIIRAAKDISLQSLDTFKFDSVRNNLENSHSLHSPYSPTTEKKQIYETILDSMLNRIHTWPSINGATTEPDLLVILGNIKSTLGFLPWHIRLTEIHWLPTLDRINVRDFQEVLWKFARCQQRFGT